MYGSVSGYGTVVMEVLSLFPKLQKLLDPYQTLSGQG